MIKYIAAAVVVTGALVGCTAQQETPPQPTVTVTEQPPAPVGTQSVYQEALAEAWATFDTDEQDQMCAYYKLDPAGAAEAVNEGADGAVPMSEIYKFFDSVCP